MAWNRPIEVKDNGRVARRAAIWRGLFAGMIVAALGGLSAWLMLADKAEVTSEKVPEKPTLIKEVKPTIVYKGEKPKPPPPKPVDPNARPTKVGEVVNGYVLLPSGRLHKRQGVVTNFVANRPKGAYEIFNYHCDNEIACYLSIKPGDTLIGTPRYNGRFKADFLESLKEPIIVYSDDTPEQAQLKRDVIAAKIELKDAMDRGEDIEQIMLDTRQELQDLMRYKMELRSQFNEMRLKDCKTEQDVEDLLDACNKMLEQRGIAPMKFGPITRKKLMQQKEQKEQNE